MRIEISDSTFLRLQAMARPLIDSVDDVINRLADQYERKGATKTMNAILPTQVHAATAIQDLRGFQRELWELVIGPMPTNPFRLRDVYDRQEHLRKLRPNVKELEAAIRNALEKLRDKGLLEFIDNRGTYRRMA